MAADEKILNVGFSSALGTMDPHTTTYTDVSAVRYHIFEGLVRFKSWGEEKGVVEPALAESWEVSDDQLTYVFKIREGVKFHDGSELTAQVVKDNFDRVMKSDWDSAIKAYLKDIEKVEVKENTVSITLNTPSDTFLNVLGAPTGLTMVSSEALEKYGKEYGGINNALVGTGPFKFVERTEGEKLVIERFDDYWKDDKPKVDKIVFYIVPESGTRLSMLQSGDLDIIIRLTPDDAKYLEKDERINVIKMPTNRVLFMGINTAHEPFNNVKLRKAMNYAVNKKEIIDSLLSGAGRECDAPIAPDTLNYSSIMTYDYNPEKAKELMAEAGYPEGEGLRPIEMLSIRGRYPMDYLVSQAVMNYLESVGFKVNLKIEGDLPVYLDILGDPKRRPDMSLLGWAVSTMDAYSAMYQTLHPDRAYLFANNSTYNNPIFGKTLDEAQSTKDPEVKKELFKEAMQIVMEDAPWIFLYFQDIFIAVAENVEGVELGITEHLVLYDVDKK